MFCRRCGQRRPAMPRSVSAVDSACRRNSPPTSAHRQQVRHILRSDQVYWPILRISGSNPVFLAATVILVLLVALAAILSITKTKQHHTEPNPPRKTSPPQNRWSRSAERHSRQPGCTIQPRHHLLQGDGVPRDFVEAPSGFTRLPIRQRQGTTPPWLDVRARSGRAKGLHQSSALVPYGCGPRQPRGAILPWTLVFQGRGYRGTVQKQPACGARPQNRAILKRKTPSAAFTRGRVRT